jgi:hypothetical protein
MKRPFRFSLVLMLLASFTLSTFAYADSPVTNKASTPNSTLKSGEHELNAIKPIGIAPLRFLGAADPKTSTKTAPTKVAKGQKYVVFWDAQLVVDWFATDGGDLELKEFKGPRAYSAHNTITGQQPDADNDDIITIKSEYIYEIKSKTNGMVFLEVFPALGRAVKDGNNAPLTRGDIVRRMLEVNADSPPAPSPDDPPIDDQDPEVRSLTKLVRQAYVNDKTTDKGNCVKELASLYRTLAKKLSANDPSLAKITTFVQYGEMLKTARESLIENKIPDVREVIGEFFDKKLVVSPEGKFDAAARTKTAGVLTQAAKALEAIR